MEVRFRMLCMELELELASVDVEESGRMVVSTFIVGRRVVDSGIVGSIVEDASGFLSLIFMAVAGQFSDRSFSRKASIGPKACDEE